MTRIEDVQPVHVAGYIEQLGKLRSAPTVKQHLACIRMLFDWMVTGQVVASNPAHAVRGPRHTVIKGGNHGDVVGCRASMPGTWYDGVQMMPGWRQPSAIIPSGPSALLTIWSVAGTSTSPSAWRVTRM